MIDGVTCTGIRYDASGAAEGCALRGRCERFVQFALGRMRGVPDRTLTQRWACEADAMEQHVQARQEGAS